jgi:hypothetical protein
MELEVETNLERCPLCSTELSQVKFREIQTKLKDEARKKAGEIEQGKLAARQELEKEFKQALEKETQAAAKKATQEAEQQLKKLAAERDQAAGKLKDAEAREAKIRKEAELELQTHKQALENRLKAQVEQQTKKLISDREEIAKKLKDAELREITVRKQLQDSAEKQRQKELSEQRQALEKEKTSLLQKQQSEFNRERESLQRKMQLMNNQLEKKTANELGDGAEIDLFEALREAFPNDRITRIKKGQVGADILHEVLYKGEVCGKIIVDSKHRQSWQNIFVSKLRQDKVEACAEHAILSTTVFPAGKKELCLDSDVMIMSPARVVNVVQILRGAMVAMHLKGLSTKERSSKMILLYSLITSEAYIGKFSEATKLTKDMLDLEVQEKTTHDNVWKKRGALVKRMQNVLREVETEVAAVIEHEDGEVARSQPAYLGNGAIASGSAPMGGEKAAWDKN